jgi:hypothetical protein
MKTKKHLSIAFALVLITFSCFAKYPEFSSQKLELKSSERNPMKKDLISNGFIILIGVGSPSFTFKEPHPHPVNYVENTNNPLGTQISLEFGNQFVFYKLPDKFGIGINCAWLSVGYSNASKAYYDYPNGNYYQQPNLNSAKISNFDFKFLKLGPMATFALGPVGLDAYIDIVPFSLQHETSTLFIYTQYGIFSNYAIGARARFKMFTAGVDINFGTNTHFDHYAPDNYKTSTFNPKFVFGFKF